MRTQLTVASLAIAFACASAAGAAEFLNPCKGRQQRADKFEFAAKPQVKKQGANYVVTFASKAACDATVAIVDGKGKIVRHLASGVLGKNAPWPFSQDSLSQSIEWDGKDDQGQPAPSGCKVRVSLGLKAKLDNILGWGPGHHVMARRAIAVAPGGNVYVLDGNTATSKEHSIAPNIRVLDSEGRYMRRIFPPMSTVKPENCKLVDWNRTEWGAVVPNRPTGQFVFWLSKYLKGPVPQTPAVTRDGRLVFVAKGGRRSKALHLVVLDGRDGAVPAGGLVELSGPCSMQMALSPDDRWLYFASGSGVSRMDMNKPGAVSPFIGKEKLGKAAGVACDKAGNIYVVDTGKNCVAVFKSDGTHLKNLDVKTPKAVAVNHGTGAVYVLCSAGKRNSELVKLGGLEDPAVKARMEGIRGGIMGTSSDAKKPQVWVLSGDSVKRLADNGTSFKAMPVPGLAGAPKGWERWRPWGSSASIEVDPYREEIYAREWSSCWPSEAIRADGRTGRVIERIGTAGIMIEQMRIAPNKDLYLRLGPAGRVFSRYNPDTGKLVPLEGSQKLRGRRGTDFKKGRQVIGIPVTAAKGARTFQDQMGIAPNGDIYMPCGIDKTDIENLRKAGQKAPSKPMGPEAGDLLKVYGADGKLKCLNALPGLGSSNGIRIGRHGAVYMALQCHPAGAVLPEGLAKGSSFNGGAWGTLVKFDSRFDKYPVGRIDGRWAEPLTGKVTHRWGIRAGRGDLNVQIQNMLWDYPGVSQLKMSGCTCPRSLFSLDGFERLFVPAMQTCTVNVLDANGNIVLRIGGYGNADCRGKDSPVPDPETGELRPRRAGDPKDLKSPLARPDIAFIEPSYTGVSDEALYVLDRGNERIVRAALEYQVEETLSLP